MRILKYILPILFATLMVGGIVWATDNFPTSLNNWAYGEFITEDWANALETTIGITNSAVITSHDYLIRHGNATFDIKYNDLTLDYGLTAATTTLTGLFTVGTINTGQGATEVYLMNQNVRTTDSPTFGSVTATGGFAGNASTADALKANGANCTNQFPLGINAAGAVESCTTITTAYMDLGTITLSDFTNDANFWTTTSASSWFNASNTLAIDITGNLTGNVTGNSDTATALAANPADCGSGVWTKGIGANGSSTCSAIANSDLGAIHYYPSFTHSTTTSWDATTTIPIGTAYISETWNGIQCFTDAGTMILYVGDGTNWMNVVNASTTVGTVALSSNNTFTAGEKRYFKAGSAASSPLRISCTIDKNY